MDIGGRQQNGFHIVDVIGKIDRLKDSIVLKSYVTTLFEDKGIIRVALNLSDVTYLDSGALNVLIFIQNRLQKMGGMLVLISPGEYVSDVLQLVGFDKLITIYTSEEEFLNDAQKI
ncbi:MAG: STAS domain-containing protein [Chitinispirillia bacterium]|nr:STAS domain-containing protein [Chitinispirillia bacterium]MCL2268385.1 STAS domain-containing protein [Chitinispirillia bacterium]